VRITSGFGGGEFTKTLRKVYCTSKTILILHDFDLYLILILCATHHLDEIAIILFVCADRWKYIFTTSKCRYIYVHLTLNSWLCN
jgi:hypothetical protein